MFNKLYEVHVQSHSKRGWSGFGRTTISQGKNKVPFYKKQVINKNTRVIFELSLLYYDTVDRKSKCSGGK